MGPAGGVKSSIEDLLLFYKHILATNKKGPDGLPSSTPYLWMCEPCLAHTLPLEIILSTSWVMDSAGYTSSFPNFGLDGMNDMYISNSIPVRRKVLEKVALWKLTALHRPTGSESGWGEPISMPLKKYVGRYYNSIGMCSKDLPEARNTAIDFNEGFRTESNSSSGREEALALIKRRICITKQRLPTNGSATDRYWPDKDGDEHLAHPPSLAVGGSLDHIVFRPQETRIVTRSRDHGQMKDEILLRNPPSIPTSNTPVYDAGETIEVHLKRVADERGNFQLSSYMLHLTWSDRPPCFVPSAKESPTYADPVNAPLHGLFFRLILFPGSPQDSIFIFASEDLALQSLVFGDRLQGWNAAMWNHIPSSGFAE
ncbi:hypothetical protein B7494_g5200 [Chlorociboria aeruginascens]|nr:hypothetical protein B7494_g5200 [Chlorociboria aeruginascens]